MIKHIFFILFVNAAYAIDKDTFYYHASPIKGLKELRPHQSSHNKKWVYATKYLSIAASYLGNWGDFDFAQGKCGDGDNEKVHLVERYKNAFKKIYENSGPGGSIYVVNSKGFLENQTNFTMEVVNPSVVKVEREIVVTKPLEYLQSLVKQGELTLYYYPNRPSCVPKDDSDLINKAVTWIKQGKLKTKDALLLKHPHLESRLKQALDL